MFLAANGATETFTHPVTKQLCDKAFYYISPEEAGEDYIPGWYQYNKDEPVDEECMNDLEIPYGQGFMFWNQDDGAKIVYAGQVYKGAKNVPLATNTRNFTAFIVPKDGKIGDLTLANSVWQGGYIMFLAANGTTETFTHPVTKQVCDKAFYYISPDEAGTDYIPGWYQYSKDEPVDEECMNELLPLTAGEGFMFWNQDDGAQLQMPAAY